MGYTSYLLLLLSLLFAACEENNPLPDSFSCRPKSLDLSKDYQDLINGLPEEFIRRIPEAPNDAGALGRNKAAYFHVRFQLKMTCLSDFAGRFEDEVALKAFFSTLEYAFSHQSLGGDFEIIVPEELRTSANYPPTASDLASGTAFFAYSLGLSLTFLQQSNWFKNAPDLKAYREVLTDYSSAFEKLLAYLKENKHLLQAADVSAPNRLLFDAIAFYTLGTYLGDEEARLIGLDFAQNAFSQRDKDAGYFIEGGGWDSSYNGVALQLGLEFLSLLIEEGEALLAEEYAPSLSCSMDWQVSRILDSGEISAEGNSRVFPGGEEFLGQEKGIDVLKTVRALFYMASYTGDKSYEDLGWKILDYYD